MSAGVPMRRTGTASAIFVVCDSHGHDRGDANPRVGAEARRGRYGACGEPDEIASVASFYASNLSSYVTVMVAELTGGRYM